MSNVRKTMILGSGPAGYTAGIYAARSTLEPLLLAGNQPGGQLTITTEVENYPGFREGITGPELMEEFKAQAERFGTEVRYETAEKVDMSSRPFKVTSSSGETYESETLIISTGASALYLGLENELALQGRGVSACATCDGFFFRDKHVHVVGGGDSACEEATFLTRFATKVSMVVRRDAFRASKIMANRAQENPKIEILWNSQVTNVFDVEEGKVTGLEIADTKTGEARRVTSEGLFLAIGHKPNTTIFADALDMDEGGYIKTVPGRAATNVDGVFACGDCMDSYYRQAVTAAGTGCMAAIETERWLESHSHS
ncbi:MAG: thioredoxin-disulfide reductase [Planctomycetota bacterium]|jgi:thioredoxin reductase (NADPH)|nr:thioredoxin-disulfide reductase [Planctomycetota bacterium]